MTVRPAIGDSTDRLSVAGDPRIGTRGLVVFYVTNLVGAGILFVPGLASQIAGPASLLSWGALALLSFPVARLFADVSVQHPECGGISALIDVRLGTAAGKTANVLLVTAFVLFNPVMGIASARYACDLLGLAPSWTMPVAAVCMLSSVTVCLARLGTTARVQGAALIALVVGLTVALALAAPSMSPGRLEPIAPHGWFAVGSAIPVVFLSFIGWEGISAIAGEVRDPRRSFPRAIAIAVPIVAIIYLIVVVAFLALPHSADSLVMTTLLAPVAGGHARAIGDVLALLIIGSCTNTNVLCGSRIVVAAARDGLLPARLARRSQRTDAPVAALVALGGAYVSMLALTAAVGLDEADIVALTTAIFMLIYLATAVAVLRDRPGRVIFACAVITAGGALCMLPFTGAGLPVAGCLTVLVGVALGARSRARSHALPGLTDTA